MPQAKKSNRELWVVLDTNVLHTKLASDLINAATKELIKSSTKYPDLTVRWYLPDVVVKERKFQMQKAGENLLPNLEKMERLLSHNLGINSEILKERIDSVIKKQVLEYGINVHQLDLNKINWADIVENSVSRIAPFEDGEKEKGFRDSLIAESYLQIVDGAPKNVAKCRVVFVSEDSLLIEALSGRIKKLATASVISGFEELKSLINTLASEVDESFVAEIKSKAQRYFFIDSTNKDTLYYREKISERIKNDFAEDLEELVDGCDFREQSGIKISPPQFEKKVGQRMHWVSRLRFTFKMYKKVNYFSISQSSQPLGLLGLENPKSGILSLPFPQSTNPASTGISITDDGSFRREFVCDGASIFSVRWSVTVSKVRNLSHPCIEGIAFDSIESN